MILMDKARCNEPVVLLLFMRIVRIHHKGRQYLGRLKCVQTYQGGCADYNVGEIQSKMDYVSKGKHKQFTSSKMSICIENYL